MWFFFAITFAVVSSVGAIIAKRVMREVDEYLYLTVGGLFTIPFLFIIVIYFYQIPRVDLIFTWAILGSVIIGIFAAIFAYRAIKISEISLVSPISAFNPAFTALIAFTVLGETLDFKKILGIIIICFGAYLLGVSKGEGGLLKPLKALLINKGIQLSLAAYFIWALTPIFEKTAIFHTTPQTPPFVSLVGMGLSTFIFGALSIKFSRNNFPKIKKFIPLFLIGGILGSIAQSSAMIAFSLGNLGLVTAIFKLSMIFTVLLGWLFFKEKNIKNRFLGAAVMLIGVFLLAA